MKPTCIILTCLTVFFNYCVQKPEEDPDKENLLKTVKELASEKYMGRKANSLYYLAAAKFVKNIFIEIGLNPIVDNETGKKSYYQNVPLVTYNFKNNWLYIKNFSEDTLKRNVDYIELNPGMINSHTTLHSLAYTGYGIYEPDYGINDFEGIDLTGKYIVLLENKPVGNKYINLPDSLLDIYADDSRRFQKRIDFFIESEIAGVILLPDYITNQSWQELSNYFSNIQFAAKFDYFGNGSYDLPFHAIIPEPDLKNFLVNTIRQHSGNGENTELPIEIELNNDVVRSDFLSPNVIGVLEGNDPAYADEYIVVSAHLDHLGYNDDGIFWGANDDATGCAVVLETARILSKEKLKRSIIFILFTSEEFGHLGSGHFLSDPPVALASINMSLNIEQVGSKNKYLTGFEIIGPISEKKNIMKSLLQKGFEEVDYKNITSNHNIIRGTDNLSFVMKGVPTMLLGGGGFPEYHSIEDKLEYIDGDQLTDATGIACTILRTYCIATR